VSTRLWSVVFDANNQRTLASYWAHTLTWRLNHREQYSSVSRGEGFLPRLEFVPVSEPKSSKNRIHFDLACGSEDDRDKMVERLIALGGSRVDIGQSPAARHVVLADPEGNEFCVVPGAARFGAPLPLSYIAYDALDAASLGRFWSAATGWAIVREDDQIVFLRSPNGTGPVITVSGPPERVAPKPVKNRVHLDVAPFAIDDQLIEVERLVSLGARRIDIGQGDAPWVVMADPEGNEFCVLTPR
jgi:predicted enzyme related to lactoylglutathione lyase